MALPVSLLRLFLIVGGCSAAVRDSYWDCQFRQLAADYARDIVLAPAAGWSPKRAHAALATVARGLNLSECNLTHAPYESPSAVRASEVGVRSGDEASDGVTVYVSTSGSDAAAGTAAAPLKTVAGAQAWIRARYPVVWSRPAITVAIQPGEYVFGEDISGHLARATRYSNLSLATFTEHDSGSSAASPITYTAAAGPGTVQFIGGAILSGLSWSPAGDAFPPGTLKATVPGTVEVDSQDQLFVTDVTGERHPLIRARTPNGKPWIPLDGFNLTAGQHYFGALNDVQVFSSCYSPPPPKPGPYAPTGPRPNPMPGHCVAAPNVTMLSNAVPGGFPSPTLTDSAAECMQLCESDSCCRGYTWHDKSCGPFFRQCYLLTKLPDGYDPWQWATSYNGHQSGLCNHSNVEPKRVCGPRTKNICQAATVVCAATNVSQVTGIIGTTTVAGKALLGTGTVPVSDCLEHLLDLANDWTQWEARSFGVASSLSGSVERPCNYSDPTSCVNTLDTDYNYPLWFGDWAAAIEVNITEDAGVDMSKYTWKDAASIVVHAMADGEWGGVQFKVSAASKTPDLSLEKDGNPILNFSYGGFQQARGATLSGPGRPGGNTGNRFYMEGAAEFLDAEGEWHFDQSARTLYIMPPAGVPLPTSPELLLTQTDTLFQFLGSSSDPGSRVEHIRFENLSIGYTSAQFFRPHEETSGGDYATHRSGAVRVENATGINFVGNSFSWIGGNAVILSASVRDVNVTANLFRWLGTSGVAVQGKTGAAMMDGRDGERMAAVYGPTADNGVRLPTNNLVAHNLFADYGIWDKQSACYHKALAPNNVFLNNICFNSSRHGVNFQDGFGGGGIAEGNLFFNLNRETADTTALNAWNRRNYITSADDDPAIGILVPSRYNEWRRNLVLGRDFYGFRDGRGDGLRNDDGSSYFKHSGNVLVYTGMQFNGGTQIWSYNNLLIESYWNMWPTPDVARYFNNTVVDSSRNINGPNCDGFWNQTAIKPGVEPGIYTGDFNLGISNATGRGDIDWDRFYCGYSLKEWQANTGQDMHSRHVVADGSGSYDSPTILKQARDMMWERQTDLRG